MIFLHQDLQKIYFPGIVMAKPRKARSVSFRHSLIVSVPSFSEKAVAHLYASVPSPKSSDILFVVVLDIVCAAIAIKKLQTILVGFGLPIYTKPCGVK